MWNYLLKFVNALLEMINPSLTTSNVTSTPSSLDEDIEVNMYSGLDSHNLETSDDSEDI